MKKGEGFHLLPLGNLKPSFLGGGEQQSKPFHTKGETY